MKRRENELTTIGVRSPVIEMLKTLQGYYQYKKGKKRSLGSIVEEAVSEKFKAVVGGKDDGSNQNPIN